MKNENPKTVLSIGVTGNKYPANINGKNSKEYRTWKHMLERCYDNDLKNKYSTYKQVTCCDEWLYYPNFYEWLHKQKNFEKWLNGYKWCLDKDILVKGNKLYSPNTCCLVPQNVNNLFVNQNTIRGNLPIGVCKHKEKFQSWCRNLITGKKCFLGTYNTPEEAFQAYKQAKESYIKQVAQEEYNKGNITKKCYEAMMNYEVEITD